MLAPTIESNLDIALVGYPVQFTAVAGENVSSSCWDFADGTGVSNLTHTTHIWNAPGDYEVAFTAYNFNHPTGLRVTMTVQVRGLQAVHYVNVGNANPRPPYTNWATAAVTIQDAVDVALNFDEIVVTNGVYQVGARTVNGTTNRVAVNRPIQLRSVNGPQLTVINGDGVVRCTGLTSGAILSGFTLTHGRVDNGAGGGVYGGALNNCVLNQNSASSGGGAYDSTLNNCTLKENSAGDGGGARDSILYKCALIDNLANFHGGGTSGSTLNNCTLIRNAADQGGGAFGGALNNCSLSHNSARIGGGASGLGHGEFMSHDAPITLNNCTLTGNSAADGGGGVYLGVLNNCIVYFNTCPSGANYQKSGLTYSCTTPLPLNGTGNLSADPQLSSPSHLSATSSCRGVGNAAFAVGTDLDGEVWANPPSMGCDEYHAGAALGPLTVGIATAYTNVAVGLAVEFIALIEGRARAISWDFGDGLVITNQPFISHAWSAPGDYSVALRAYNEDHPDGVSAVVAIHVVAPPIHYVAASASNPISPYATWATAARNIQDAVDAATLSGGVVWVTNGIYATGGRITNGTTNRVALEIPLILKSINGPQFTVIDGQAEFRGVYLTKGAVLEGFTVTNSTADTGGGVWCASATVLVSNCILTGNSAKFDGGGALGGTLNNCTLNGNYNGFFGRGGGASDSTLNKCVLTCNLSDGGGAGASASTLNNCTLARNVAGGRGGGAIESTLNNCTLTENSAYDGGGAYQSTLDNCTLTVNTASYGGGAFAGTLNNCTLTGNLADEIGSGAYESTLNNCIVYYNPSDNYYQCTLNYCCTTPMPNGGFGNITNAPIFIDQVTGILHLDPKSPCINAGKNSYAPAGFDLEGNPRIVGGTVDIGAYEYQAPTSVVSYAWLQQHALPTDGSADHADSDGDRFSNFQEWRAGTDPTNPLSLLRLLTPVADGNTRLISWQSAPDRTYTLERSINLNSIPLFVPLAIDIPGYPGTNITTFSDTNTAGVGPYLYRVRVEE